MTAPAPDPAFEELLTVLDRTHRVDFSGYRRSTLMRRVRRRMDLLGIASFADYAEHVEVHAGEFGPLVTTILINVTAFFRDPPAWQYLQAELVPRMLAGKPEDEPIRVWSAGCASGEEPYSLAIVLAEALGVEACGERVRIYATDIDEEALEKARRGSYSSKEIMGVPAGLRGAYFEELGSHWVFRGDLRRSVVFGRHDLVQDAPISRLDLLVSRNTLMYFTVETQARILARLHEALRDDGYLLLGRAEMLLAHPGLFTPVELRHRVFSKVPRSGAPERLLVLSQAGGWEAADRLDRLAHLRESSAGAAPMAQLTAGVTPHLELEDEVTHARQELETACEELETTNEELQSTVEGLETTNEELQSANEELETINEELHATSSELQSINAELRDRTDELDTVNVFMDAVLGSIRIGVVVVDAQMRVRVWNGRSEDLWGLRPPEVIGEPLLGLDIGLPIDQLSDVIRDCIARAQSYGEMVLDCVNRRGRRIRCRVMCSSLVGAGTVRNGAILLVEEIPSV